MAGQNCLASSAKLWTPVRRLNRKPRRQPRHCRRKSSRHSAFKCAPEKRRRKFRAPKNNSRGRARGERVCKRDSRFPCSVLISYCLLSGQLSRLKIQAEFKPVSDGNFSAAAGNFFLLFNRMAPALNLKPLRRFFIRVQSREFSKFRFNPKSSGLISRLA